MDVRPSPGACANTTRRVTLVLRLEVPSPHPHPECAPPTHSEVLCPVCCRLRQPVQPHTAQPQPVRGRGADGPAAARGAGEDHAHVPLEGWHSAGLAGGGDGHAYVCQGLRRECQEWEGRQLGPLGNAPYLPMCALPSQESTVSSEDKRRYSLDVDRLTAGPGHQ